MKPRVPFGLSRTERAIALHMARRPVVEADVEASLERAEVMRPWRERTAELHALALELEHAMKRDAEAGLEVPSLAAWIWGDELSPALVRSVRDAAVRAAEGR